MRPASSFAAPFEAAMYPATASAVSAAARLALRFTLLLISIISVGLPGSIAAGG
jgi:hypothetical protein